MPSPYYAIMAIVLFDPIHMVSIMFMDKSFALLSALNLAVYLPLYYGLSGFFTENYFKFPRFT